MGPLKTPLTYCTGFDIGFAHKQALIYIQIRLTHETVPQSKLSLNHDWPATIHKVEPIHKLRTQLVMKPTGFLISLAYIKTGWQLVRQPGLRRFVWMPLLINIVIFGLVGWWIHSLASQWLDNWALLGALPDWWIVNLIRTIISWLFSLVLLFSLAFIFTLVANLIGAPFNGLLAERVEAHLTGKAPSAAPSWLTLVKSVPRLMTSELSKLLYLAVCIVPLLLLQFVPLINIFAPLLLFLFGAWMFALEYVDYPMGNHGALFGEVRRSMRKHRRVAFGFGSGVALISMIPIINLFIMPVAVAGATALYVDHLQAVENHA